VTPVPAALARLIVERRPFASIDRDTWDRLAAASPWATPFSSWAFHRAWWDAYGENAHEETMVVRDPAAGDGADPVAIVPLMHRHEVEPTDAERHTTLRHGSSAHLTSVPPTATAIFFGASYHADYATVLAAPGVVPAVADALAADLRRRSGEPSPDWDAVDLRRLRSGDPAGDALTAAFRREATAAGWTVTLEREDVCPVAALPVGGTLDDYLGTLDKKERHEIRRKVRRAETAGEVLLAESADPLADLESFIELHQARWADDGLFPTTPGGAQSRLHFRRLFELFGAGGPLRLSFLTVAGRRIAAGVHFETPDRLFYYNAGVDPGARDLSPGVVMVERFVRRAIEHGQRQMDFLRGDEPYKYEWGAVDEPIQRLLVRRGAVR
jgi:CelD/BcsL family acetyltransferase involved in cellulose biosynthesis